MEGENRYIIDIKKNTLTLTNPVDFVPIGTSLLFVYARTKRANAYGKLHPKPYFFYVKTYNHNGVSMIQLPEDKKNDIDYINEGFKNDCQRIARTRECILKYGTGYVSFMRPQFEGDEKDNGNDKIYFDNKEMLFLAKKPKTTK